MKDAVKPRFIAVLSTYRLLHHGYDLETRVDHRKCLQADGTHKINIHGFPALLIGRNRMILHQLFIYLNLHMLIKGMVFIVSQVFLMHAVSFTLWLLALAVTKTAPCLNS